MSYMKCNPWDYPLLDYPCKHWWVRYAVGCTLLKEEFDKIWEVKLKILKQKYKFNSYYTQGKFKSDDLDLNEKQKIILILEDETEKEINICDDTELWQMLYAHEYDSPEWIDCPYEHDHQSQCPFYEKEEGYAHVPLEKLRTGKW